MKVSIDEDQETQTVGVTQRDGSKTEIEVDSETAEEFLQAIRGEQ
jgi:hypothetical protein